MRTESSGTPNETARMRGEAPWSRSGSVAAARGPASVDADGGGGPSSSMARPPPPVAPSRRDTPKWRLDCLSACIVYCVLAWLIGVYLPSASLHIMPGTGIGWSMTKSLTQTLTHLWEGSLMFAFIALFFFSVFLPIVKIIFTIVLIHQLYTKPKSEVHETWRCVICCLTGMASYQFVDLYVGVLFVAFFNSDSSNAHFRVGFYFFFSYCVVSSLVSGVLEGVFAVEQGRSKSSQRGDIAESDEEGDCLPSLMLGNDVISAAGAPRQSPRFHFHKAVTTWPSTSSDVPTRTSPDLPSTCFFSSCFLLTVALCWRSMFLEVRMLLEGVAIDRNALSLEAIMVALVPSLCDRVVVALLWLFLVVCPLLYMCTILARACLGPGSRNNARCGLCDVGPLHDCLAAAEDLLRQWAMADVFALAALIFLFMIQDNNTLTMPAEGSIAFYALLAGGFSFFFLRWFVEAGVAQKGPGVPGSIWWRSLALVTAWLVTSVLVLFGVLGGMPKYEWESLPSVCRNAMPLMSNLLNHLPAAYGDCDNVASQPPTPCSGHAVLDRQGVENSSDSFSVAVWLGGLNSMGFESCNLWEEQPGMQNSSLETGHTRYHFAIAGTFAKLSMYLHARSCSTLGCVNVHDANHCCGENIGARFNFLMDCKSNSAGSNFSALSMVDFDLDPMIVQEKMLGDSVTIDAMDISPKVEKTVRGKVRDFLHELIPWGKQNLTMAEFLNKVVRYNRPHGNDVC